MPDTRGPIARAVGASLTAADKRLTKDDQGAAALARRYADLIDHAAPSKTYARALRSIREALDVMRIDGVVLVGFDAEKAFEEIAVALAAHTVASDLGPKLLATLTALGLTPAGRDAKGAPASVNPGTPATVTDELRQRRATRAQRARVDHATTVDTTTT